jgi:hypothetical protein
MKTAFATPLIVQPDQTSVPLERVSLSGAESTAVYSEDWLQNLLYSHPQTLPIAEIDDSFSGLVPVCREMVTSAGKVDVVYVTPTGRAVIVEAKLWRNPEARREVIGQVLDYAKELSRWNYEGFDAAVRQARRAEDEGRPKGLLEILGIAADSQEAAGFFDAVTQSLRRGDLLLLIVGDGIREGVGAIAEFLEGHGSLHFTFGLVEMAIFQLPDGGQLVQPRVLVQSTIVRRTVVEVLGGAVGIREEDLADVAAEEQTGPEDRPDLLERRAMFEGFWQRFLERLALDNTSQPIKAPSKGTNQVFHMPDGSECWVSAYLARKNQNAGVFLTWRKNAVGQRICAALQDQRPEILELLGDDVDWDDWGIVRKRSFPGELTDPQRDDVVNWLVEETRRFIGVFRPRIEKLARESV